MDSNKLSFLLTLFGRSEDTLEFLNHFFDSNTSSNLYISDSSLDDLNQEIVQDFIQKKKIKNIIYKRYPADENFNTMLNKFSKTLGEIESEYCIFLDNDDFIDFKNIEKNVFDTNFVGRIKYIRKFSFLKIYNEELQRSINNNEAFDRLADYANKYFELWYNVSKTKLKKEIIDKYMNVRIHDINLFYPFYGFEHVWDSSHSFEVINFMSRKIHQNSLQASLKDDFFHKVVNPKFINQLEAYLDIFCKQKDISKDLVRSYILNIYMERNSNKVISSFIKKPKSILSWSSKRLYKFRIWI